jgi:hypothetical protein
MMPAMYMRSSTGVVGYMSVLERDALALNRTCVSVQTKNAAKTANQAKNNKQNKKNRKTLLLLLLLL